MNLFAGLVGAIVENKSLDESLKEVGLSETYLFEQCIAPQSSDVATKYVKEVMAEKDSGGGGGFGGGGASGGW